MKIVIMYFRFTSDLCTSLSVSKRIFVFVQITNRPSIPTDHQPLHAIHAPVTCYLLQSNISLTCPAQPYNELHHMSIVKTYAQADDRHATKSSNFVALAYLTSRVAQLLTRQTTKLLDRNHLYSLAISRSVAGLRAWSIVCLRAREFLLLFFIFT